MAEESPDELLAALTAFLAPYRDGSVAAHNRPHAHAGGSTGGADDSELGKH
jgi:hypothetical protein